SRLFSLECLRPFQWQLRDIELAEVLDILARRAEGESLREEFQKAEELALKAYEENYIDSSELPSSSSRLPLADAVRAAVQDAWERYGLCVPDWCCNAAAYWAPRKKEEIVRKREQRRQAALIREIFGNPYRPVALDSSWLTSYVLLLARGIYADLAFDR